jgi:archaetidylinositol phosphate synthase
MRDARAMRIDVESKFQDAKRIQESILSPLEKKTLLFLASRMPSWVNSDHLTTLGFIGMILAGVAYWLSRYNKYALILTVLFLAINWFGDSLDGTLARYRGKLRPRYGFYVDHIVDTFGALFLLGGLALSGYMHYLIALGLLIIYYMFSIEIYLATYCIGQFRLSYGVFGPTELRVLLSIGNLVLIFHPMATILGHQYKLFDVGGICGIAGMGMLLVFSAIRNTVTLYRQERI